MWPSVDCDGRNVARAAKATLAEHAVKLLPNYLLEIIKRHGKQLCGTNPKLRARVKSGIVRSRHMFHMYDHRLAWTARVLVTTHGNRKIERHTMVERHGRGNVVNFEIDPWLPVTNENVGVDQGCFDVLRECSSLRLRQIRHDVRNNHM